MWWRGLVSCAQPVVSAAPPWEDDLSTPWQPSPRNTWERLNRQLGEMESCRDEAYWALKGSVCRSEM